ncbi:MAG: radical SAM protein [[Clostridium] leptum]
MIPRRRDPIGLYLHILLRRQMSLLRFLFLPAGSRTMDDYCGRLISELFLWGEKCPRFVDTLYFGGGTLAFGRGPLVPADYSRSKGVFLRSGAEITVEMNPCSAGGFDFPALRLAGANRISIGLQSALDAELQFLGRRHTARQAWDTAAAAQRAGFRSVSLDLMLGLEGQTTDSVRKSVAFCRDAGVTHVSAYLLKIEPGTRFSAKRGFSPARRRPGLRLVPGRLPGAGGGRAFPI